MKQIKVLSEPLGPCIKRSIESQIIDQSRFYKSLSWKFSDYDLVIPRRKTGFDRLLVIANTKLTDDEMYRLLRASFPCSKDIDDLNEVSEKNGERRPVHGPYAIWVKDCIEIDDECSNKSACAINNQGLRTLTLLERMYLEALVYYETGNHLDSNNSTLCSVSGFFGKFAPSVRWDGKFNIRKVHMDHCSVDLRYRQVVTT